MPSCIRPRAVRAERPPRQVIGPMGRTGRRRGSGGARKSDRPRRDAPPAVSGTISDLRGAGWGEAMTRAPSRNALKSPIRGSSSGTLANMYFLPIPFNRAVGPLLLHPISRARGEGEVLSVDGRPSGRIEERRGQFPPLETASFPPEATDWPQPFPGSRLYKVRGKWRAWTDVCGSQGEDLICSSVSRPLPSRSHFCRAVP